MHIMSEIGIFSLNARSLTNIPAENLISGSNAMVDRVKAAQKLSSASVLPFKKALGSRKTGRGGENRKNAGCDGWELGYEEPLTPSLSCPMS
jgi:hypothetical protein